MSLHRIIAAPCAVFLALLILLEPALAPAAVSAAIRSAAVSPVLDGNADEASQEAAAAVANALRMITPHHIVEAGLAARVAAYQSPQPEGPAGVAAAGEEISRAKEYYFAFRTREAGAEILRAQERLEALPPDRRSGPMLVDALVTRAVIERSRGDTAAARAALARALAVDPLLSLQEERYPPSLLKLLEEERARVTAVSQGSLAVESRPAAAEVTLNGIPRGVTPLTIEALPSGTYALEIVANQYAARQLSVRIEPGRRATVKERLRWERGKGSNASAASADEGTTALREGLRISRALKVDRAILVDADRDAAGATIVTARTVDRELRAAQAAVVIPMSAAAGTGDALASAVTALAVQLDADLLEDPSRLVDPIGEGDPALAAQRRKPITRQPLFWAAIGTAAAGGIIGGILASMSGSPSHGAVKVSFK